MNVTIPTGVHTDTLVTACKQFTTSRHRQTYTATGNHDYIITNAQGCKDTITLKLTITNGVQTDTLVTACKQFTWSRDGQTYTATGNHDYIITNAQGCKDTITLKLTITNGVHTDTLVTACKQFTWSRDGQTYTATGIHDYIITYAQGCKDTITLKLTITNGVHTDTLVTACKQFTWSRDGQRFTDTGNQDYIITNAQGCKDTITLKLTITNGVHTDTLVTACKQFTWSRDGQRFTDTGNQDYI